MTQPPVPGGIIAPVVTPVRPDGGVDHDALERNAGRLLAAGVHGLYICGGTGDGQELTAPERMAVAEVLVPLTRQAGVAGIVHVGQAPVATSRELAEHAACLGATAVAAIPPPLGPAEVEAFYRMLGDVAGSVVIYHIPKVTHEDPGYQRLSRLLEVPGVAGIKVSDWNLFLISQIKRGHPDVTVFNGFDELVSAGLSAGADGAIGTWINLLPRTYLVMFGAHRAGNGALLLEAGRRLTDFLVGVWDFDIIAVFESLMAEQGYARQCFRSPMARPELPAASLQALHRRAVELELWADRLIATQLTAAS